MGPIPDSISKCGDLIAPELKTTRSDSMVKISPPLSASTPIAFCPANNTFLTNTLPRTVRFSECLIGFRCPRAALIRSPSMLFEGETPIPSGFGPFVSSQVLYPAPVSALRKACCMSGAVPDWRRLTGMGPSVPWKSSRISRSVSHLLK